MTIINKPTTEIAVPRPDAGDKTPAVFSEAEAQRTLAKQRTVEHIAATGQMSSGSNETTSVPGQQFNEAEERLSAIEAICLFQISNG